MYSLSDKIENYVAKHTSDLPAILNELERETYVKLIAPQMISGKVQGQFLQMFSNLVKPKNILEVGTYSGYSTICLAMGLQEKGKIVTIDINEELESIQNKYFEKSGFANKIENKFGNALEIIPSLEEEYDLVFLDADKKNYCKYYELILPKIKKGGFLIADNVLWYGKVVEKIIEKDKDTKGVLAFNEMVQNDDRVENLLLVVRDGMMVVKKL